MWRRLVLGWEEGGVGAIARKLGFWRERLNELPDQIALPSDRVRPAIASHRGGRVEVRLDGQLHGALLELARASGASLFMVLQAGLAALLTGLGSGSAIGMGGPTGGGTDGGLEELIGVFVNREVLSTDTSCNP